MFEARFTVDWLDEDLNSTNALTRRKRKRNSIRKYPTVSNIQCSGESKKCPDRDQVQKLEKFGSPMWCGQPSKKTLTAETPPLLKGLKNLVETQYFKPATQSNPPTAKINEQVKERRSDFTLLLKPPPMCDYRTPSTSNNKTHSKNVAETNSVNKPETVTLQQQNSANILDLSDDSFLNNSSFLSKIDQIGRESTASRLASQQCKVPNEYTKITNGHKECKVVYNENPCKIIRDQCKVSDKLVSLHQNPAQCCKPISSQQNQIQYCKPISLQQNRTPKSRRESVLQQDLFAEKWNDDSPFNKPSFWAELDEIQYHTQRPGERRPRSGRTVVSVSQISEPLDASTPVSSATTRSSARKTRLFQFHKQRLSMDDDVICAVDELEKVTQIESIIPQKLSSDIFSEEL